jgi:DnaJ-class molecular chaperone
MAKVKKTCPHCRGSKTVTCPRCGGTGYEPGTSDLCATCAGTKWLQCPKCDGAGTIEVEDDT